MGFVSRITLSGVVLMLQESKVGMDELQLAPAGLAEMIALIDEGIISGKIAKDVLPRLLSGEATKGVRAFVESQGLVQISGVWIPQEHHHAGWHGSDRRLTPLAYCSAGH